MKLLLSNDDIEVGKTVPQVASHEVVLPVPRDQTVDKIVEPPQVKNFDDIGEDDDKHARLDFVRHPTISC